MVILFFSGCTVLFVFKILQSWIWCHYWLSKTLCNRSICLWDPIIVLYSAINIVASLCFLLNKMRLIWPGLFLPFSWSNLLLATCSHMVRPFVCFCYNKSTLSDVANCTVNVFMYNARRLWASGPFLYMCQVSVLHPWESSLKQVPMETI